MNVGSLVDDFVKLHDAWVPKVRQSIDLTMDGHLSLPILQIFLVICLDRNHVLSLLVCGPPDNSEGSLAHLQVYLKVFHLQRLLIWVLRPSSIYDLTEVAQLNLLLFSFIFGISDFLRSWISDCLRSGNWSRTCKRVIVTYLFSRACSCLVVDSVKRVGLLSRHVTPWLELGLGHDNLWLMDYIDSISFCDQAFWGTFWQSRGELVWASLWVLQSLFDWDIIFQVNRLFSRTGF